MSNHEGDVHMPRSKKQKVCESGEVYVDALGGPMYDEATARKMLKAAPVRPASGGGGEGEVGFDPDDAALDNVYHDANDDDFTPLIYFAYKGDLKMMRYLIFRGASTTKWVGNNIRDSPMHIAVVEGCLDSCKLLHANGAQDHVRLKNEYRGTPFLYAANFGHDDIVRWLVLHGALCHDDDSDEVNVHNRDLIHHERTDLGIDSSVYWTCKGLVDWSKDVLQAHSSMVTFLLGTLPPTPDNDRGCILQCLSGHPGIRKHIGDFVGLEVIKAKQLRILRSLVKVLPEKMRIL